MWLLNEIAEKLLKNFLSLKEDDWIEWIAQPNDWQDACDKFNGCYFIVKQMPKYKQHPRCQCWLNKIAKLIPYITENATCDIRKFAEYVFDEEKSKGKKELFEGWGYTIEDSEYLQQLYISQAIQPVIEIKQEDFRVISGSVADQKLVKEFKDLLGGEGSEGGEVLQKTIGGRGFININL